MLGLWLVGECVKLSKDRRSLATRCLIITIVAQNVLANFVAYPNACSKDLQYNIRCCCSHINSSLKSSPWSQDVCISTPVSSTYEI